MIIGLEHTPCEERLGDLGPFRLEMRRMGGILSTLTNILRVDVKQIISMVPSNRTRGNGHKFKHRKFYLNMRKNFTVRMTEHRNKLPREAEESLSLEIFKTLSDAFLYNLL